MQRGWQNKNFWTEKHILVIYKSGCNSLQSVVIMKSIILWKKCELSKKVCALLYQGLGMRQWEIFKDEITNKLWV